MTAGDLLECWRCKSSNPAGKKFCGDCGAALDAALGPLREAIQTTLRDEIRAALKDQVKDQKLLELETTENVQNRVLTWTKNVGLIMAVAFTIAGFGLAWLGTSSWKEIKANAESTMKEEVAGAQQDIHRRFQDTLNSQQQKAQEQLNGEIERGQNSIQKDVDSATETTKQVRQKAESLSAEMAAIQPKLADFNKRLTNVEDKVSPGIRINLYNGTRQLMPRNIDVVYRVRDGNQKEIVTRHVSAPSLLVSQIPFNDNVADNCLVMVSTDAYNPAGFTPVKLSESVVQSIDLMLLPKSWKYVFSVDNPNEKPLLPGNGFIERFETTQRHTPDSAAMLLNVIAVGRHLNLPQGDLIDYFEELDWDDLTATQVVAYVRRDLIDQLEKATVAQSVTVAGRKAFKEISLNEASLRVDVDMQDQRRIQNVDCVKLIASFVYFKDPGFHFLMEILTDSNSPLRPEQVYALRWMSGRKAGMSEFAPAYTIVAKD